MNNFKKKMKDYISRKVVLENVLEQMAISNSLSAMSEKIKNLEAANVIDIDEGIKMGAELAAMHGSGATSQELEKAYFDGMEEGYKIGHSGFEKRSQWMNMMGHLYCMACGYKASPILTNYCPNCGSLMMKGENKL